MSPRTRLLLVRIDRLSSQVISDALAKTATFDVEVAQADFCQQIVNSTARWDAVIVCAGNETLAESELLAAREHLGFCPLVVILSEPPADEGCAAKGVLTLATRDFSPRALQLLLRSSGELKAAGVKLASLEATAKIKSDLLAKQNELIHNLTSRLCHEVRSPLTAARQYATLISREQSVASSSSAPELAERALHCLDDLSMMVDDVSALSQWEFQSCGLRRRATCLPEITQEIEHVLRDRARLEGVELELQFDDNLPKVFADPDAVGQAVRNLAVNSLEHAEEGQCVQLWAHENNDGHVLVGIEDQFSDVDQAAMDEAFREFCNAEVSLGSGFQGCNRGLAVARRLLELNLSELRLESRAQRGSIFLFQLPNSAPERLVGHYLSVLHCRRPRTGLSLLTFSADASSQFAPHSAIDDFLQTSTTADDLVLQTAPLRWTALVCGNRHEVAGRLRLLDDLWAQRRERDSWLDLPPIRWQQHENWLHEFDKEGIAQTFLEAGGIGQDTSHQARRILLVDNHPERVLRLTHQLEVAGFNVVVARDGREGMSSAAENHPDAIVWDAADTDSCAAAALKQFQRQDGSHRAPVIMLASNMRQQQQALEQGAKAIFGERLRGSEVVEAVQRSLADRDKALVPTLGVTP